MVEDLTETLAGVEKRPGQHQQNDDEHQNTHANDDGERQQYATEWVVHVCRFLKTIFTNTVVIRIHAEQLFLTEKLRR
jgi:hypothetical protein